MNESILQVLMRLFGLVAFVDDKGKPIIDRDVVSEYLQRQYSNELVKKYLKEFDRYIREYHPNLTSATDDEKKARATDNSKAIKTLCTQLNMELEQEQKIFILVYLLDFIHSGAELSSYQFGFVEMVAQNLHIAEEEYNDIKHFTFGELERIKHQGNLMFIDRKDRPANRKIKHLKNQDVEGRIVVLHISSTNTFVFRHYGTQVILLNGHNIKSNRSYIWAVGSVIKNEKFGSIYYTWVAGKFIKATTQSQFVFTANNIEFSYGSSPNGVKKFNLNEESGRLIGIIGGSGSGKSTLLKVLCGILPPKKGNIEINGFDIHEHEEELKGVIGYVPQDDFLIKELTTYENLYYNARLSFGDYSEDQIEKLVNEALLSFDLVEARDLRVGDSLNTYLSGGQRKRLNIALELIREPAILFIDEPTSGLSSMDSEKVMNLLKRQTFKGKLVFANIHQPSSEIFKLLDKLLVVDQGGRVIWYGNPVDAISYFKRLNHYVDAEEGECLTCGNINVDHILRNVEGRVVDVNGRLTRKRKTSPEEWYELYMEKVDPIIRDIRRPFTADIPKSFFSIPAKWQQMRIYLKRDLLSKIKSKNYLLLTLLEAPILALILAFYTRNSRDLSGNITDYVFARNYNIPAYLFMAVIVALFLGLIISSEEIFKDRKILERERFLNLSRFSYLFSKIGVMFTISAIQMLLFTIIGHFILEIKGMYLKHFLILFTAACWANIVGLNISAGFKSVVTIYILIPLILVPQLLFSGVVVDFHNLNKTIQSYRYVPAVGEMMTSRWAYESLVVTQTKDNPFDRYFFESEQKISNAMYCKAYLIPELVKNLNEVNEHIEDRKFFKESSDRLTLLQNEIRKLARTNVEPVPEFVKNLEIEHYSQEVYQMVNHYLMEKQKMYHSVYLQAIDDKTKAYKKLTRELGGKEAFTEMKEAYHNDQLHAIAQNNKEMMQFFTFNNNIIKMKDPIYTLAPSKTGRAHFYAPAKRLGNYYIDTFWFNLAVVWIATFGWFIVLYFDLLNKTIIYFDSLKIRRINRKIMNALSKQG